MFTVITEYSLSFTWNDAAFCNSLSSKSPVTAAKPVHLTLCTQLLNGG